MPTLEFTLDPSDISRLTSLPGIRATRAFPIQITWHDTPGFDLARQHLALQHRAGLWSLIPLYGSPSPLAEARFPALLGHRLPEPLEPKVVFRGRRQSLRWTGPASERTDLRLVEGRFTPTVPICTLVLEGEAAVIGPLATTLAAALALQVPRSSFAERALAAAGLPLYRRKTGTPAIAADQPVGTSLAAILGHLLEEMLHSADQVSGARTPEPVHQMRVATRRLRSALSIFTPATTCPELVALGIPLRACAAHLGAARDWDVFLETTAPHLTETLTEVIANDRRYPAMLRAATRRRRQVYTELAAYLTGPEFRTLTIALACAATLRPWAGPAHPEALQATSVFAAATLSHRVRHVQKAGRNLATLTLPALHELRKDCKRLRYAAEFFRPLFPHHHAKRFLGSLSELQEELGLLNDTTAITGLMIQLGRPHTFATGLMEGAAAAGNRPARTRIARRWKTFRQAKPFW